MNRITRVFDLTISAGKRVRMFEFSALMRKDSKTLASGQTKLYVTSDVGL